MCTPRQNDAVQNAFKRGQQAFRDGKSISDNPFPQDAAAYHLAWDDGYVCEYEAVFG